jgi:ATP-dependent RNA helicase DeaD
MACAVSQTGNILARPSLSIGSFNPALALPESNNSDPKSKSPPSADSSKADSAKPAEVAETVRFADLPLSDAMKESLEKVGYENATPVQAGVIPKAIEGVDVIGQARTGTGKTASFVIPILERLPTDGKTRDPQALVMVPTRELAVQVSEEANRLAYGHKARCVAVYGGKPIRSQITRLQRGVEIVVGTPGRVLDLAGRGALNLSKLSCVVLDEADRMLDIGFRPDIEKILRQCPTDRQTLLLSATVAPPIERLAQRYMKDPVMLNFSIGDIGAESIDQYYFTVEGVKKFDLLVRLLQEEKPQQAIVFCRTKRGTDKVFERLNRKNKDVACIHGDMQQNQRDRAMSMFRERKVSVLVATDVVGRGIDVSGISHIINYDIPEFCDDYVHRVGRTGRMGREGVAYTFVAPEEGTQLTRIELRINKLLERKEFDGFQAFANQPSASATQATTAEPEEPKAKPKLRRRHRRAL